MKKPGKVKRYPLTDAMKTNLASMETYCHNKSSDAMETGDYAKMDEWDERAEECAALMMVSWDGYAEGKYYARIKEISDERNLIRYSRNLEAGKSEREAAYAFQ